MKKNKRVIFNGAFLLIVFVLTIYGVFHGEDLGAMMDAIRSADKRWLVPGLALVAFFIWGVPATGDADRYRSRNSSEPKD